VNHVVDAALDVFVFVALVGSTLLVVSLVLASVWSKRSHPRPLRRRAGYGPPPPAKREWMLWVGDGMAPAGPDLVGRPVAMNGRTGKVVDATALMIQVEWDT